MENSAYPGYGLDLDTENNRYIRRTNSRRIIRKRTHSPSLQSELAEQLRKLGMLEMQTVSSSSGIKRRGRPPLQPSNTVASSTASSEQFLDSDQAGTQSAPEINRRGRPRWKTFVASSTVSSDVPDETPTGPPPLAGSQSAPEVKRRGRPPLRPSNSMTDDRPVFKAGSSTGSSELPTETLLEPPPPVATPFHELFPQVATPLGVNPFAYTWETDPPEAVCNKKAQPGRRRLAQFVPVKQLICTRVSVKTSGQCEYLFRFNWS